MSKSLNVRIEGCEGVPMLMSTWYGIDPLNPLVKEMAKMRGVQSKHRTDEWHAQYRKLDWMLGLYHDKQIGPYIPAENIIAAIIGGAKKKRKGAMFAPSITVEPGMIPLEYDGPRDVEALYADKAFVDIRPCEAGSMKVRPCFRNWALSYIVLYDDDVLDERDIKDAHNEASIRGIGSYRPRFGKFDVVEFKKAG